VIPQEVTHKGSLGTLGNLFSRRSDVHICLLGLPLRKAVREYWSLLYSEQMLLEQDRTGWPEFWPREAYRIVRARNM
jgi:hypothetical protein